MPPGASFNVWAASPCLALSGEEEAADLLGWLFQREARWLLSGLPVTAPSTGCHTSSHERGWITDGSTSVLFPLATRVPGAQSAANRQVVIIKVG
jgi:hypothetical protein